MFLSIRTLSHNFSSTMISCRIIFYYGKHPVEQHIPSGPEWECPPPPPEDPVKALFFLRDFHLVFLFLSLDGIVESSDGESGSEDEVIDLSASEEEEESRDEVVELYETDEEENGDCHDPGVPDRPPPPIPDRSFPVDKPLPQLPPEDDCDIELNSQESASLVGPSSVENSEDVAVNVNLKASERGSESPREEEGGVVGEANEEGETERGEMGEKSPKLLPIFSFEEEEESLNQDVPNHSSKVIENTVSDKNDAIHTEGNCQREKSNDTHLNSDIDNRSDTSQSTKKNENVLDGTVTRETDDKAR